MHQVTYSLLQGASALQQLQQQQLQKQLLAQQMLLQQQVRLLSKKFVVHCANDIDYTVLP